MKILLVQLYVFGALSRQYDIRCTAHILGYCYSGLSVPADLNIDSLLTLYEDILVMVYHDIENRILQTQPRIYQDSIRYKLQEQGVEI